MQLVTVNKNTTEESVLYDDYKGKSKEASFWSIVYNSMLIRIKIWKRYGAEAVGAIVQLVILMSVFYLFATAVGFRGYNGFGTHQIYIFFMTGLLIMMFDGVSIYGPLNAMQRDLTNGTLEYLYFTPMRKYPYFFGYSVGTIITNTLIGFLPLYILLVFYANMNFYNAGMILVVIAILLLSLLAMGILISLTIILWKQVQGLVSLLGLVLQFFTGGFIPVSSLPPYIQTFAFFFPHTYAYDLIRYYAYNGQWTMRYPLMYNWILIIGFTIFYTILAVYLLGKVVNHAKQQGLHIL